MFGDLGLSWMNGKRHGAVNNIFYTETYVDDLAPTTVLATLGMKVPEHDVSFGWTGTIVGAQGRTPYKQDKGNLYAREPSAGYAVHGIFLDWTPKQGLMQDTELHVALDNIFDKKYLPYLSDGISAMPGRNFKISVSRRF